MTDVGDRGFDETPVPRRRRRWGRRIALTFLALVLLLVAGHWGAGRRAADGLGSDLAAYRAAGEPASVEELNHWPRLRSGEGENAVPLLRAAAKAVDPAAAVWKAAADALHAPPLDDGEVAAIEGLLKANAAALEALDEATSKGRIDWDPRYKSPAMATAALPADLTEQRSLVQLAHAAALAAHRRGDDAEALRRAEQMIFVGRALDHQPGLTYHLVSLACDASAARLLANLAPDLRVGAGPGAAPPRRVRELIVVLLDERALAEGQRRAWVGERVMQIDIPNAVLSGGGTGGGPFNLRVPGMGFVVRPLVLDNARVMARYTTALMRAMDASPDLPAFKAAVAAHDPAPEVAESPRRYGLAAAMIQSLARAADAHYRALADRRLAAACLAVRLYAVDHGGKLPGKLDDLVPAYLPSVPPDPLAAGGAPLRYVGESADPERPRLYGVGVDGADDGGVDPPAAPGRRAGAARSDEVRDLKRQPRPPKSSATAGEGNAPAGHGATP